MSVGVGKRIYDNLNELIIGCEVIRDNSKCDKCPLKDDCLEECTFEHIAYKVTADAIEQLIFLADEITEEEEERNKTEYDRTWEAEADYWNDRRCDPDE